jgi:hypothetical protein
MIRREIPRIEGQPIALAGGVFANVRLNKLVKEMGFGSISSSPRWATPGSPSAVPCRCWPTATDFRPTGSPTCTWVPT